MAAALNAKICRRVLGTAQAVFLNYEYDQIHRSFNSKDRLSSLESGHPALVHFKSVYFSKWLQGHIFAARIFACCNTTLEALF